MGFSIHIPLGRKLLKIKSADRLRNSERRGKVPVFRVLSLCFVWLPNETQQGGGRNPDDTEI